MEIMGQCPVCDDTLEYDDAGFCKSCGQAFCWGDCGTWFDGEHCCGNCMESKKLTGE